MPVIVPKMSLTDMSYWSPEISFEMEQGTLRIYFTGPIFSDEAIIMLLNAIAEVPKNSIIHIYIASPGGCIASTLAVEAALNASGAKIYTYNLGMAASCGSYLLVLGDKIWVGPGSSSMFHGPSGGWMGSAFDAAVDSNRIIKVVDRMLSKAINKGLLTSEEYERISNHKVDLFLNSIQMRERLVKAGINLEEVC